jgi:hypothetical protein
METPVIFNAFRPLPADGGNLALPRVGAAPAAAKELIDEQQCFP